MQSNYEHDSTESIRGTLLEDASRVASRARRQGWWRASVAWATIVVFATLLLLLVDMLFRYEETGLRFLAFGMLLVSAGYFAYRIVSPAWKFRPTPVDAAKWIEQSDTTRNAGLTTTIQLARLPSQDTRFGSEAFRNSAIRNWHHNNPSPSWERQLATSNWWRYTVAFIGVVVAAASLLIARPADTKLAFYRLATPWASNPWPLADRLQLIEPPSVVAIGARPQLEIIDLNAPAPPNIQLQVRPSADNQNGKSSKTLVIPTRSVGDIAVGNLPRLDGSILVRAIGGDDRSMRWHHIDVIQPPTLNEYQFSIQPPAYSREEPYELVGRRIKVLAGSSILFTGSFSEPIHDLGVRIHAPSSGSAKPDWQCALSPDKRSFVLSAAHSEPLPIRDSLKWRFQVTSSTGLAINLPQQWSVEVTKDQKPIVTLQQPALLSLTTNAQVLFKGKATDDLGLVSLVARIQTGVTTEPIDIPIYSQEQSETPETEFSIDQLVALNQLPSLTIGQPLTAWVEATDTLGQVNKSQPQRFSIQSSNDVLFSIERRVSDLLNRIRQLIDSQRGNQQLTARTASQIAVAAEPRRRDLAALTNAQQIQQAIALKLSSQDPASVSYWIESTIELFQQNQLNQSDTSKQLMTLAQNVEELARGRMNDALRLTIEASDSSREMLDGNATKDQVAQTTLAAAQAQSDSLSALQEILRLLSKKESQQQLKRELSDILKQQRVIQDATDAMQIESFSGRDEQTLADQRASLQADQMALARQLDGLARRAQSSDSDIESIPSDLSRATNELTKQQTSQRMRIASQEILNQEFALAVETQRVVVQSLEAAMQEIGQFHSHLSSRNLKNQAEELTKLSQNLAGLSARQEELSDQMRRTADAEDLASQQATLRQATREQTGTARKADAHQLIATLNNVIQSQKNAETDASLGKLDDAADSAMQAAKQLEQASREIGQQADSLAQASNQQQIFELGGELQLLVDQQTTLRRQLEALDNSQDNESAAHGAAVRQEKVRLTVQEVRVKASQMATLSWTLELAESDMARAIAAAKRLRIRPEALEATSLALRKLTMAADAFSGQDSQPLASSRNSEDQSGDPNDQSFSPLASLKLIRSMQLDLHSQTLSLNKLPQQERSSQKNLLIAQQRELENQLRILSAELSKEERSD